ncbi:MAG TPA: hypothetical protein ENI23_08295 [bacterium]|nr:hypothetical protein [bacterium]
MTQKNGIVRGIIDLDNVVSDWLDWYINQIGMMPTMNGLQTGQLTDMYPDVPVEELEKLVADRRGYSKARPVKGAVNSLRELLGVPGIELSYVSAAIVEAEEDRRNWMRKHDISTDSHPQVALLLHVGTMEEPGHGEEKKAWIEEHGADYDFIIDDQLKYLDAAWTVGIEYRYAFFQLWNAEDENHTTVFGWEDFLDKLKEDFPSLSLDK